MKLNRNTGLILVFVLSIWLVSCDSLRSVSPLKGDVGQTDPDEDKAKLHVSNNGKSNETVNNWIYQVMDIFYLWSDKMPDRQKTDLAKQPDDFFGSLLYQYGEVDRFSWIDDDAQNLRNQLGGITKSPGYSVTAFRVSQNSDDIIFAVRYVIKNTPAEKAGVKRGDIITRINGTQLKLDNYVDLLYTESQIITLGQINGSVVSETDKTISIVAEQIQNYPVHYASVMEFGEKKVGYLVYNQFISGIGGNDQFNNELKSVFGDFKGNGINELIVDFRYNGGGLITSADLLSSLIVKDLKPGTLMNKQEWSAGGTNYAKTYWGFKDEDFNSYWSNEPNNVGSNINRVFFLVSGNTASASEMVINNLLPFMEVILIGDNTYGKDVGSITLDDAGNNYRWDWGLQPIVLRTVNALGQSGYGTKDGFIPTHRVDDRKLPYKPFGDPEETLLSAALKLIDEGQLMATTARRKPVPTLEMAEEFTNLINPGLDIKDMFIELPGSVNL